MTAALVDQFRGWLLRPRIVHRLPGRLRLRLPELARLDRAGQDWSFAWRGLFAGAPEIQSVEANPTTGSVLIRYRPDELTEAELVAFLEAVNRFALRRFDRLAAVPPAELPEAVRRLVNEIRARTRRRLAFDDSPEAAADV